MKKLPFELFYFFQIVKKHFWKIYTAVISSHIIITIAVMRHDFLWNCLLLFYLFLYFKGWEDEESRLVKTSPTLLIKALNNIKENKEPGAKRLIIKSVGLKRISRIFRKYEYGIPLKSNFLQVYIICKWFMLSLLQNFAVYCVIQKFPSHLQFSE